MRSRAVWLVVMSAVAGVLMASPGYAQIGQGRLAGTATDAQGAVLPGVTVTVTSPSLIGTRTTVTEADGRYLFPALPSGAYKLVFELQGFRQIVRDNIQVVLGQTISVDAQTATRRADRERHRHRRLAGGRRRDDQDRHQPERRRADRRAELDRRVGRALGGAGRPHAGIRRRRQPQEPAVGLRSVRRPEPGARRHRRCGSHRGRGRHRVLRGLLRQRGSLGQRPRRRRRDELAGRGDRDDHQERRQRVQGPRAPQLRAGQLRRQQRRSGGHQRARLHVPDRTPPAQPQCANPNLLFWEGHARSRRPDQARQGVVLRRLQPLQDRQGRGGRRRERRHRPRRLRQLHRARCTGKVAQSNTLIGYIQRGRKQKPKRGLSTLRPPESIQAQDSWSRMYKGEWQWVVSNRTFLNVNVGNFTLDWPMVPAVDPAVAGRRRSIGPRRRCAAPAGTASRPYRKKPQVKAQLTYYLPRRTPAATTSSSGSRIFYDSYRFGINGSNGPYPALVSVVRERPVRSHPLRRHRRRERLRHRLDGRRRSSTGTTASTRRIAGRRATGCRSRPACASTIRRSITTTPSASRRSPTSRRRGRSSRRRRR